MDDIRKLYKNENTDYKQDCKKHRKKKKLVFLSGIVLLIIMITIVFLKCVAIPHNKYNQALSLLENKEYLRSYNLFKSLGDYKDSEIIVKNFRFLPKQIREYNSEKEISSFNYIYDANNSYLKAIYSSFGGVTVTEYFFDNNGNCTEAREDEYIRTYCYDGNGNCIKELSPYGEITYKYDERGNLIEEKDNSGDNIHITEYIYDNKNNCTRRLSYRNNSNSISSKIEYTYDENGNCIKEEEIDEEGNRQAIQSYSYDEKGNCIQSYVPNINRIFNMEGPARTIKNIYDEKGNCIKKTMTFSYASGAFNEDVTEYVYDPKGNCVEETSISKNYNDEKIETAYFERKIEYTYDESGNCIKKADISKYGTDYTEYKDYFIIYARQDLGSFKERDI